MRGSIRMVAAAALLAAPLVLGVAAPAGARSAAPRFSASPGGVVAAPNSNIAGKGATAKFKPAKLTAEVFFSKKDCKPKTGNVSFTVTNPGTQTVNVTYLGHPAFTLPGKSIESLCVYGPPGTLVLGLQGSMHTLKVTLLAD
jgi:hypothetical protein